MFISFFNCVTLDRKVISNSPKKTKPVCRCETPTPKTLCPWNHKGEFQKFFWTPWESKSASFKKPQTLIPNPWTTTPRNQAASESPASQFRFFPLCAGRYLPVYKIVSGFWGSDRNIGNFWIDRRQIILIEYVRIQSFNRDSVWISKSVSSL